MRIRFSVAVAAVLVSACGSDKKSSPVPTLSQLNEACQYTAECAAGLACVPSGGTTGASTCQPAENNVIPNTKVCVAVQCEQPIDCCETRFTPDSQCSTWTSECALSSTTYPNACDLSKGPLCDCSAQSFNCVNSMCSQVRCKTTSECCAINNFVRPTSCDTDAANCLLDPATYATACTRSKGPQCNCDDTVASWACVANQCATVTTCASSTDCYSPNRFCNPDTSRCVQCLQDTDCTTTNASCVNNVCVTPACITDADCSPFYNCVKDAAGLAACKKVGCFNDRECMLYMDSYLAFCDPATSGDPAVRQCVMKCDRDTQCTSTDPLGACVNGRCQPAGCETNEECKIRLENSHTRGTRALCQEKPVSADAGT